MWGFQISSWSLLLYGYGNAEHCNCNSPQLQLQIADAIRSFHPHENCSNAAVMQIQLKWDFVCDCLRRGVCNIVCPMCVCVGTMREINFPLESTWCNRIKGELPFRCVRVSRKP